MHISFLGIHSLPTTHVLPPIQKHSNYHPIQQTLTFCLQTLSLSALLLTSSRQTHSQHQSIQESEHLSSQQSSLQHLSSLHQVRSPLIINRFTNRVDLFSRPQHSSSGSRHSIEVEGFPRSLHSTIADTFARHLHSLTTAHVIPSRQKHFHHHSIQQS